MSLKKEAKVESFRYTPKGVYLFLYSIVKGAYWLKTIRLKLQKRVKIGDFRIKPIFGKKFIN